MRLTVKSILIQALLLAWLLICIAFFVIASQSDYLQIFIFPGLSIFLEHLARIAPLSYMLNLIGAMGGIVIFSLACFSLGLGILRDWARRQPMDLAITVTAFILGEIVFSLIFLTLLNLSYLTSTSVSITLILGFLLGLPIIREWIPHLSRPILPAKFQRRERIIVGLLGVVFALGLLYSSSRLSYDAVAEYFSHAKIMAVSRRPIFFYPTDSFVVSSFHPGILLTAIIQLFGDQSARMLLWVNGLAILLFGIAIGKELGMTPRVRLWFLTLMLTSTAFVDLLGDGKIELISTAPILASIYWMQKSVSNPSRRQFVLIGILTSFAIISRPYNIFLVSVFIGLFFVSQAYLQIRAGSFNRWRFVQLILWMILPLILLGTYHLFENWFFLSSPIAPLTYARNLKTTDWQWQFDPGELNAYRLLYPFVLTFINSPQSLGNISPLFVASLPFLLIRKIRQDLDTPPQLKWLVAIAISTLVLWITLFFTVVEIRYVFFLWVILFLFIAQVVESVINNGDTLIRPLIIPLLIELLVFIGARTLFISLGTYSPIDKDGQAYCYDLSLCAFIEPVNQVAVFGDRVLVLNAYRYYLRPDLFACSSQSNEYPNLEALATQNSPEFWVEAYRQGFRYVTYEKNFALKHSHFGAIPDPQFVPSWLHVTVIFATPKNAEVVYSIDATNPPIEREKDCIKTGKGILQISPAP
jgi:hypothetical protein